MTDPNLVLETVYRSEGEIDVFCKEIVLRMMSAKPNNRTMLFDNYMESLQRKYVLTQTNQQEKQ